MKWIEKIEIQNQKLVPLAQSGDLTAINKLYDLNQFYLEGILAIRIKDSVTRQEIISSVQEKVFSSLPTFQYNYKFTTFIYGITKNVIIDQYRTKNADKREESLFDSSVEHLDEYEEENNVEHQFISVESESNIRNNIINQINQLKNEDIKLVMKLYFIDEYTYDEIELQTGFQYKYIKSLVHRGRLKMVNPKK